MTRACQLSASIAILLCVFGSIPVAASQAPGSVSCGEHATPAASSTPDGTGSPATIEGRRIELAEHGGEALVWDGNGPAGVVLVHGAVYDVASWKAQATQMAAAGQTVIAVEHAAAGSVVTAAHYLRDELEVQSVTLVGASAGGSAVLGALGDEPELADRLVLLSATGDVTALGDYPKLFVASEGEGIADRSEEMAEDAAGDANQALIVPGDAHAQAIFKTGEGDDLVEALIDFIATGCV